METLLQWDTRVFYFFNSHICNGFFDVLMPFVTNKHNWIVPIGLLVLGLLTFGKRKGQIVVLLVVLSVMSSDLLCSKVLKPIVRRPRPSHVLEDARVLGKKGGRKSFPSNHAANITAAMLTLAYFYRRFAFGFLGIAGLISFSRIYVGVHYPLDVLCGMLVGAALSASWLRLGPALANGTLPQRAWIGLKAFILEGCYPLERHYCISRIPYYYLRRKKLRTPLLQPALLRIQSD